MAWDRQPLSDFLTDEQCKKVAEIVAESKGSSERVKRMKAYLGQFKEQLEAKGINPDFMAYDIEHAIRAQQGRSEER